MLGTLMRTKTFWAVAVVLFAYGVITWDDNEPAPKPKVEPTGEVVKMALEIMMSDTERTSTTVAVAASLGSIAGSYAERRTTVYNNFKRDDKPWIHRFTARRGDHVNAEVAIIGPTVNLMFCVFWQEHEGSGQDSVDTYLPGYGDITGAHIEAANGTTLARCQARAR